VNVSCNGLIDIKNIYTPPLLLYGPIWACSPAFFFVARHVAASPLV
jgi:hypothetical protein